MSTMILGIDLGKNSRGVVGLDANGLVVVLRRPSHGPVAGGAGARSPADVAGRCPSLRQARKNKARKNGDRDAEAAAEAATRPTMRFVELESETQRGVQTLPHVRDRLAGERISLTNEVTSLLQERGVVVARGHARLRLRFGALSESGADAPSPRMAFLLGDMRTRWEELDRRIAAFDAEFAAMARTDDRAGRLAGFPGIGAPNATAPRGRVWCPARPPPAAGRRSRGSRRVAAGIFARNRSGAHDPPCPRRPRAARRPDRGGARFARAHPNVAVVVLASKMARTVWARLRRGRTCQAVTMPA